LKEKDLVFRTFAAGLAWSVLRHAPDGWRDAILESRAQSGKSHRPMSVPGFVAFSVLLGFAECWVRAFPRPRFEEAASETFVAAVDKIRRSSSAWGLRWAPGAARLYLFSPLPGSGSDLLALSWD